MNIKSITIFLISVLPTFAHSNGDTDLTKTLTEFKDKIEIYDGKAYKKPDIEYPWQLKCTSVDRRIFHGCVEARFFDPSTRVYFDSKKDGSNQIDLFHDGNLNLSLDFVSLYLPWRLGKGAYYDRWAWGPMAGVGISSAAKDSGDNSKEATSSPVVLFSLGFMLEYKFNSGPSFGFELGRAVGYTSDESFGDNSDEATYVGLKLNIPFEEKKDPVKPEN